MNIYSAIKNSPRTQRSKTFDIALRELHKRFGDNPVNIVETGTIRQLNDRGDGWSTAVWDAYIKEFGGRVWTCDINENHIGTCIEVTRNSPNIKYVVDDSINFLKNFQEEIHLLYLDSYDTGGSDENIFNACFHQLKEIVVVLKKLHPKALIMLDDVPQDFKNGKGELSIPFIIGNGFEIINYQEPQIIFGKKIGE